MALRLAISNGMARESSNAGMKRSDKTHRNRLWWTIYMQERYYEAYLDINNMTYITQETGRGNW